MNRSFCRTLLSAALLSIVIVTPCLAQNSGRGGQGGPRGFGGGMMGGGDAMLLGLLRIEKVQKDVGLMPDQIESLAKVGENLRDPDFDFRAATEEERNAYREKMNQKVTEQLEELLLPEQLERTRQIGLQVQGSGALSDPEVAKKLNLTDDQKKKLEDLQTQNREKMGAAMREAFASGDREAVGAKMAELRKSGLEEAKGVLTAEQKTQFDALLGKPIEISMAEMMGGRGRGGPGGRGGNRRGDDSN